MSARYTKEEFSEALERFLNAVDEDEWAELRWSS